MEITAEQAISYREALLILSEQLSNIRTQIADNPEMLAKELDFGRVDSRERLAHLANIASTELKHIRNMLDAALPT